VGAERFFKPIAITASVLLAGFITFAVVSANTHHSATFPPVAPPSRLSLGTRAPAFSAASLGAQGRVRYPGHSTKPVVINFFASDCANCVAELDAFATVSKGTTKATFLGVDSEDPSPATAERLLHNAGISYPIASDGSGSITTHYLIAALPVTFFIAANGKVMERLFGQANVSELRSLVARLERFPS
jgi:peroxiredoxin